MPQSPHNATPAPDPTAVPGVQLDITGCNVLLVDDHAQNLELLAAYLEDLGCEIRTTTDGQEALDAVAQRRPDLILLDVMMPRMSGFQVCAKLKRDPTTAEIPVVMVTALNEVADVERARDCGANDFITKPVNKAELLMRVRSQLQVALVQRKQQRLLAELRRLSAGGG
jgi:two-component system, OmpR family, alkaline phosphatase synthesis response regulator PhoP